MVSLSCIITARGHCAGPWSSAMLTLVLSVTTSLATPMVVVTAVPSLLPGTLPRPHSAPTASLCCCHPLHNPGSPPVRTAPSSHPWGAWGLLPAQPSPRAAAAVHLRRTKAVLFGIAVPRRRHKALPVGAGPAPALRLR